MIEHEYTAVHSCMVVEGLHASVKPFQSHVLFPWEDTCTPASLWLCMVLFWCWQLPMLTFTMVFGNESGPKKPEYGLHSYIAPADTALNRTHLLTAY